MPALSILNFGITGFVSTTLFVAYRAWFEYPTRQRQHIRNQLPNSLHEWRLGDPNIWSILAPVCRARGLELWPKRRENNDFEFQPPNGTQRNPNGYSYALPQPDPPRMYRTINHLRITPCTNPSTRMVRSREGADMAIKVIVIRHEGRENLDILRKLATGDLSFDSTNHALPMFGEFVFEDIVFGLFPVVTDSLNWMYGVLSQNSVGDILDMIMQALEALAFIHKHKIAHRDAFKDNFLLDFHLESLITMTTPTMRPRVYLVDFEVAVQFPLDAPSELCVLSGLPLSASIGADVKLYARPHAPEMGGGNPYNAFRADVWQLGSSLDEMSTTICAIDAILEQLRNPDPHQRPTADAALQGLKREVQALPPLSLLIPPALNLRNDIVE